MPGTAATTRHLPTLRQLLLLLAFACVLPAAALAIGLVAYQYQRERAQTEASTIATARAVMAAVDGRFERVKGALQSFAPAGAMSDDEYERLHDKALVLKHAQQVDDVILLDSDGWPIMNTAVPFGAALSRVAWPQIQEEDATGPRPAVLDLFQAPGGGKVAAVAVPLPPALKGPQAFYATISPASLREVLVRQGLPANWIAAVLDRSGTIVARTHDHEHQVGTRARADLIARMALVPEDAVESVTVDGVPVLTSYSRSATSGWSVAIGIPRAELRAPLLRTAAFLFVGTLAVLLLTAGFAWLLADRLSASVEKLGSAVRATGHRASLRLPPAAFQEARQLGMAFAHAHAALGDANAARERGEARMRAVLDTASDAIVTADDEGRIILFNRAAEVMFRLVADDAMGRSIESLVPPHLRILHEELRRRMAEGSARRMAGGRVVQGMRADGTTFQAEASISVAEDEEGGRLYTVMLREVPTSRR